MCADDDNIYFCHFHRHTVFRKSTAAKDIYEIFHIECFLLLFGVVFVSIAINNIECLCRLPTTNLSCLLQLQFVLCYLFVCFVFFPSKLNLSKSRNMHIYMYFVNIYLYLLDPKNCSHSVPSTILVGAKSCVWQQLKVK